MTVETTSALPSALPSGSMERLLHPRSVAIVGASDKPGALGASVLSNLDRSGYAGAIHLINPKRTEIGDRARVTYHSTVLSGVKIGKDAILGSLGVASKPVEPGAIVGGVPAKPIAQKSVKP